MAVYRFKVTYEDHEEVYRDIEIKAVQTFEDFHNAIQQAIAFDNSKPASFFLSDDYWRRGPEITLRMPEDDESKLKPRLMSKCKIASFIEDPHQKFLYVSDFSVNWTFWVELTKIILEEEKQTYPRCIKSVGNAPKQYKQDNLPPPPLEEEEEPGEKKEPIFTSEEQVEVGAEGENAIVEGEDDFNGEVDTPSFEEGTENTEED